VTKPHLMKFTIHLDRKLYLLLEKTVLRGETLVVVFGVWLCELRGRTVWSVRGFPSTVSMLPEITNDGYLTVIFRLSVMQNTYPRHPQNFQSRLHLAGYEWDTFRLNRGVSTSSRFTYDDATTLPDRME